MSTSTYEGTLYFLPWFCIKVLTEIFLREGSSSVSDTAITLGNDFGSSFSYSEDTIIFI